RRQPGPWIALAVIGFLVFVGLALIPVIGSLATMVLAPVFVGGVLIGCREEDEGRTLLISHLFAGFRERLGTLVGGGADAAAVAGAGLTILLALLVMFALMLPVFMAMWFAPALAVFHQQGPAEAMKSSFIACLRNIMPFLLYSVIVLLLAIAASIPLGLGWLVLGPTLAGSLYAGYRDLFFD